MFTSFLINLKEKAKLYIKKAFKEIYNLNFN